MGIQTLGIQVANPVVSAAQLLAFNQYNVQKLKKLFKVCATFYKIKEDNATEAVKYNAYGTLAPPWRHPEGTWSLPRRHLVATWAPPRSARDPPVVPLADVFTVSFFKKPFIKGKYLAV